MSFVWQGIFSSKFVKFLSLFEEEKFHTFYNGLQSFSTADTYKTGMIKLLNDHSKMHRYRGHVMNAATREVRKFHKCTNTMSNLPKCIKQFDSQTITGVQLLWALSSKWLIKQWDTRAASSYFHKFLAEKGDVSPALGTLPETLSQFVLFLVYLQNIVLIYQTVTFTNLLQSAAHYSCLYFPFIRGKCVKIPV
jgi:hypothetical protein